MNCIVVDDEPNAVDILKRYVEKTPLLTLRGTFRDPVKAQAFLKQDHIDLIFLDINMPNLSGIEFMRSLHLKPAVIFTTAYSEHAVESYELDAIDYLVKPIVFERFLRAVNKAHGQIEKKTRETPSKNIAIPSTLLLKSGSQTHRVAVSEILYIEKTGNYMSVCLTDRKILIRANMNDVFSWLPADQFCRVHKSFLVSIAHVDTIEVHQLFVGKVPIPLGAAYRSEFLERMKNLG